MVGWNITDNRCLSRSPQAHVTADSVNSTVYAWKVTLEAAKAVQLKPHMRTNSESIRTLILLQLRHVVKFTTLCWAARGLQVAHPRLWSPPGKGGRNSVTLSYWTLTCKPTQGNLKSPKTTLTEAWFNTACHADFSFLPYTHFPFPFWCIVLILTNGKYSESSNNQIPIMLGL